MPAAQTLPVPGGEYFEIETAKLHGGWAVWERLPCSTRGRLLAHEQHKAMREHYAHDLRSAEGKATAPKVEAPWDAARNRFFGGQPPVK